MTLCVPWAAGRAIITSATRGLTGSTFGTQAVLFTCSFQVHMAGR